MRFKLPVLIGGGVLLGVCLGLLLLPGALERILPTGGARAVGQATIGGPFTLTDHRGRRVTDQEWRGKYTLVFFGFTFCPDVCPTALQVSAAALDKLGPKADRVAPLFISVDHERDTPEMLARYVSSFHPRLVGLTGSAEEIAAVTRSYRVYFKKVKDDKSGAAYTYDHSSIVYLMAPDGKFVTHFTHTTSADAMAAGIQRHVK
jgi:cytochrome oxidase Cu insertion factor (SCO1/SenC/PrrC family)